MTKDKRPTLFDVAQRAGVSYQTVSRVVNNHHSVAPRTRAAILDAIRDLHYRPNNAARSLVTQRSRTVGILSYGTAFYGPGQMLANIEASLRQHGYSLTLSTLADFTVGEIQDAIHDLRGRAVDGLVLIIPIRELDLEHVERLCGGVPLVMIDIALGQPFPSVVIDQRHGGLLVGRHLIEMGHRSIAEISGPLHWSGATLRHEGVLSALREAALEPVLSLEGDWSAASGYAATQRLLAAEPGFGALVAGNDQMALGALRALRERGLRVPEDVSVIGFDDLPEAAFFEPPLTTVRQDFTALGKQSAEYLIARIEVPSIPPSQRVLEPQLVVRSSTRHV